MIWWKHRYLHKVEVAPSDKEARDDFNKFVREMIDQNTNNGRKNKKTCNRNIYFDTILDIRNKSLTSNPVYIQISGFYDRRFLTGNLIVFFE